ENRDASAAIVVRSRTLVIEMTAINNFSGSGVGAGNCGGHDRPVARTDGRFHVGIQNYVLAAVQSGSQRLSCLARDHEGKSGWLTRIEMPPANDGCIQSGPRGGLVRHVADDASRAMLGNSQLLHAGQNAIG